MPKRSPSQNVPKDMQARFDEIAQLTDTFSQTYLNDEYRQLCRELTATLCRLSPQNWRQPSQRHRPDNGLLQVLHSCSISPLIFEVK